MGLASSERTIASAASSTCTCDPEQRTSATVSTTQRATCAVELEMVTETMKDPTAKNDILFMMSELAALSTRLNVAFDEQRESLDLEKVEIQRSLAQAQAELTDQHWQIQVERHELVGRDEQQGGRDRQQGRALESAGPGRHHGAERSGSSVSSA